MSIFNDKSLKSVAEAAAKIMEAEKMAKKDYDGDGKIESSKDEVWGSRLKAAKLAGKMKEDVQDLDEASYSAKSARAGKDIGKPGKEFSKIAAKAGKEYGSAESGKKVAGAILAKLRKEEVELEEDSGEVHVRNKKSGKELMIPAIAVKTYEKHGYFPVPGSVKEGFDDMDKYMKDKNKESSFEKKKTDKGTAYSRKPEKTEKKVEEGFDDMDKYMKDKNKPQPSGSAGKKPGKAYGGSKQPEEKKSMSEMLELYNEHGLKVLSMMNTKSVKFGDTEVELLDADDVNGFVETVVEEVDNETFTKEVNAQKEKAAGKGKKAEVAKASVQAVKQEEVEHLDELSKSTLGSYVKKASHSSNDSQGDLVKAGRESGVTKAAYRTQGLAHKKGTDGFRKYKAESVELGEARKLEGSYKNAGGHESKVYKLSGEHNEGDPYHVKLFKGGKHHEPADYFTNDKDDAHSTAKRMVKESLSERHLTAAETEKKEDTVKSMKKNLSGFKARYGDKAKSVMYATATKQAKKD